MRWFGTETVMFMKMKKNTKGKVDLWNSDKINGGFWQFLRMVKEKLFEEKMYMDTFLKFKNVPYQFMVSGVHIHPLPHKSTLNMNISIHTIKVNYLGG